MPHSLGSGIFRGSFGGLRVAPENGYCGGGEIIASFLDEEAVDAFTFTVVPSFIREAFLSCTAASRRGAPLAPCSRISGRCPSAAFTRCSTGTIRAPARQLVFDTTRRLGLKATNRTTWRPALALWIGGICRAVSLNRCGCGNLQSVSGLRTALRMASGHGEELHRTSRNDNAQRCHAFAKSTSLNEGAHSCQKSNSDMKRISATRKPVRTAMVRCTPLDCPP